MTATIYRPKGIFRDRIRTGQGRVLALNWRSNLVVDRCRFLIAAFMRGDGSIGIQQVQIGQGSSSWDTESPDPPAADAQQLTDRTPFVVTLSTADIEYLDVVGNPTTGPTNRLQITINLAENEPPPDTGTTSYPLREFGLFGNFGGEDYMINYVRHPVIHKQADDTMTRTIRLVF